MTPKETSIVVMFFRLMLTENPRLGELVAEIGPDAVFDEIVTACHDYLNAGLANADETRLVSHLASTNRQECVQLLARMSGLCA